MADLFINMSITKWPKYSLHVKTTADRGQSVEEVLKQAIGLYDALNSSDLDIEFLREHVGAYLTEAFASGETHRFAKVYGDDTPLGTDWRLYIDGITPAEVARQEECMGDIFARGERQDALVRMVRLDEELGLTDVARPE
jgi:hypothetical protein